MDAHGRKMKTPPFAELYREAMDALDTACDLPPLALSREVDLAERAVAKLRDGLIEVLRAERRTARTAPLPRALERVNVALSLIVGVEYPATGIHRKMIEQARELLKEAEMLEFVNPT